jgi:hypothetical protein
MATKVTGPWPQGELPGSTPPSKDQEYQATGPASSVSFLTENVPPPSPLYVGNNDIMYFQVASAVVPETVTFNWRVLTPDGTIKPGSQQVRTTTAYASMVQVVPLSEGYLLSVGAVAFSAATRGQTFVRVNIGRISATAFVGVQPLFADYVTNNAIIGWPFGRYISPVEGSGRLRSFQVSNPAAGVDWIATVPTFVRWRVQSFTAQLVTAVAAANRNVEIIVDDSASVVWRVSAPASIVASTTQTISGCGVNAPTGVITTTSAIVIPPGLIMPAAWRLRTATTNIQAADQWGSIFLNVEEWIDLP